MSHSVPVREVSRSRREGRGARARAALTALAALAIGVAPAIAGKADRAVAERWRGAWVVIGSESYSDCSGRYTDNRVAGRKMVHSRGAHRFEPGELGKITKIDVKRSRIDVFVELETPILIAYQDGPFTLYDERACRLEFMFGADRSAVKRRDADALEAPLVDVLERFDTRGDAFASSAWNGREPEPYPEDYEHTLLAHARWRAEQANLAVDAAITRSIAAAATSLERVDGDDDGYASGFAAGIERMRDHAGSCDAFVAGNFRPKTEGDDDYADGFADGQVLAYHLAAVRALQGCYVPVPDGPALAELR